MFESAFINKIQNRYEDIVALPSASNMIGSCIKLLCEPLVNSTQPGSNVENHDKGLSNSTTAGQNSFVEASRQVYLRAAVFAAFTLVMVSYPSRNLFRKQMLRCQVIGFFFAREPFGDMQGHDSACVPRLPADIERKHMGWSRPKRNKQERQVIDV